MISFPEVKVNLGLEVLRKRPDGYHDLRMIMQTVKLYDQVTLSMTRSPGVRVKSNLRYLPADKRNHAYQAAQMLMEEFGITSGVSGYSAIRKSSRFCRNRYTVKFLHT